MCVFACLTVCRCMGELCMFFYRTNFLLLVAKKRREKYNNKKNNNNYNGSKSSKRKKNYVYIFYDDVYFWWSANVFVGLIIVHKQIINKQTNRFICICANYTRTYTCTPFYYIPYLINIIITYTYAGLMRIFWSF